MSDLRFNEENDYSEENTSDNEDFRSTILQSFQFDLNKKTKRVVRSSRPDVFYKKDVLRNLAKFTAKHLCQSLFFKKLQV